MEPAEEGQGTAVAVGFFSHQDVHKGTPGSWIGKGTGCRPLTHILYSGPLARGLGGFCLPASWKKRRPSEYLLCREN